MRYCELVEARLRFYHGTSSLLLPVIQRDGLIPQIEPVSAMRGNGSTIPGYTEHMVFLAPFTHEAAFYAKKMCDKIGGKPILLSVKLLPSDPLRVSDDYIIRAIIHAIMQAQGVTWLTADDFDKDGNLALGSPMANTYWAWHQFLFKHQKDFYGGNLEKIASLVGIPLAPIQAGYAAYQKALQAPWQASASRKQRDPAVAFEGTIPPDRITVVNASSIRRAIHTFKRRPRSTQML